MHSVAEIFYNGEMLVSRFKTNLIFLSILLLLNACSGTKPTNSNSANANFLSNANSATQIIPQDNVEALVKIVKLNYLPEEATYSETNLNSKNSEPRVPAPNEKKIVAVLKFSGENAAQVIAQAEKYRTAVPSDIDAENWFPEELIAQSRLTGDQFLKGATYAANDFYQTPYINGRLTRINDTNYFVLELTTF